MSKKIALVSTVIILSAGSAIAGGHNNKDAAQAMVEAIQSNAKGVAKELNGKGAFAQQPSNRGWGNAGSDLLSTGPAITDFGNKPKTDD